MISIIKSSGIFTSGVAFRAARMFSSECQVAERLRGVLHDYRSKNYSMEVPTRFQKEILRPYVGNDGAVEVEQLNRLLTNIGHPQDILSPQEQNELLKAAGSTNNSITVKKMIELIQ